MRALRWGLGLAAALLGVALLAAWLVPPALNWDFYRTRIAALASITLGQAVRIDGSVALRLLPQPELTAGNVTVLGGNADNGASVTVKELRLRVALWPLLGGHVDARELVLHGMDARLPWPLGTATLALRAPPWLAALRARVEDGRLRVGAMEFTALQASLATREDTGTWVVSGTAMHGRRPWHFTSRLSRPGADGSATIDLTLDSQSKDAGAGVAITGQVAADGTLTGRASGRGADLSRFLPAPAVPFRAEGRFVLGGGLAFADELQGEIGGAPASGAVSLRLDPVPRLDVSLATSRIDLDAWLPPLLKGGGAIGLLPTGVDLSAEAATLAGGTLRRLRAGLEFAGGTLRVRDARADLPGDAALTLQGQFTPADAAAKRQAAFAGSLALRAPALRTTLAWAGAGRLGRIDALPTQVLRSAAITAKVQAGPEEVALDGIAGTLDGERVGGALSIRPGPVPALRGWLTTDRLDLAPWVARLAGLGGPAALAGTLGGVEADLRVEAKRAMLDGRQIAPFVLDAAAEANRLTLRRLALDTGGVEAQASGTLEAGGRIANAQLALTAKDGRSIAALLPDWPSLASLRDAVLWHGAAALAVQAAGPPDALAVKATADLGDLHVQALPVLDLGRRSLTGSLLLRHPGAPRLLGVLGLPALGAWVGPGSLSLVTRLTADAGHLTLDGFDISAGALHAAGSLAFAQGGVPVLTGTVAIDTLPLPALHPRARGPLPLGWLAGWQAQIGLSVAHVLDLPGADLTRLTTTASLAGGVLRLDALRAQAGGGTLSGSLRLDAAGTVPSVEATLALRGAAVTGGLFGLPMDVTAGQLDAEAALHASGFAPATLLASLGGQVALHVHDGTLTGLDLTRAGTTLREPDLRAALAGGSMAFDRLDVACQLSDGVLTLGSADLTAPSGSIGAEGRVDLVADRLDLRLAIRPQVPDPPALGLRLSGRPERPERTPELAALAPWRAARGL